MTSLIGRFQTRVKALALGSQLDRELAEGVNPDSTPVLHARAAQLTRAAKRRQIAARIESIVQAVERSKIIEGSGLIYDREEIERARPELLQLVQRLRESGPHAVQGVAIAAWLVTDLESPIFSSDRDIPSESELTVLSAWAGMALRSL